jgi:hypothetical protein
MESFTFLYAYVIHTSQEAPTRAYKACYGYSVTILYADDVRASQETHMSLHGLLRG